MHPRRFATMRSRCIAVVLGFVSLCTAPSARADDTDEVEVSAFGGMHVRSDLVSQPATNYPSFVGGIGAGPLGGVELAYRHDFSRWSLASGLRVQYETYALNGWLDAYEANGALGQPRVPGFTSARITTFSDSMVAIGIPFRVQMAHAQPTVGYVVLEPMIVVHSRQTVADYSHDTPDGTTSIQSGVTTRDDHQYFAAYGAVGVAVRAGPGRFFVELGARVASDAHGRTGFASPAGWSLIAGYRLGLR